MLHKLADLLRNRSLTTDIFTLALSDKKATIPKVMGTSKAKRWKGHKAGGFHKESEADCLKDLEAFEVRIAGKFDDIETA
jgi:hypothetical protein